jgi:hypothetical protein
VDSIQICFQLLTSKKTGICFSCYQNITRFITFIRKVIDFREKRNSTKKVFQNPPEPSSSSSESQAMETEPFESIIVKSEPEFESIIQEKPLEVNETASETTSIDEEEDFSDESNSNSKSLKVSCIHFTCANCKTNYDDFDTLTKHITSRVSQEAIKRHPTSYLTSPGLQHKPEVQTMPKSLRQLEGLPGSPKNPSTEANPPKHNHANPQVFTMPTSLQLRGRSQNPLKIPSARRENRIHLPLHSMP